MLTLITPIPAPLPTDWQELMNLFYAEWQAQGAAMKERPEEERVYVDQAAIAAIMPAKINMAVMLGNMNYQVHNGGWAQWIDNRYYVAGPTIAQYLQRAMDLGQTALKPIIEALDEANKVARETDGGRDYGNDTGDEDDEYYDWDREANTQFWNANPEEELAKALDAFDTIHGLNNYADAFKRAA